MIKKKKERETKIPDAGMSDIVFLLLLFFLVSTTIDVDTGIGLVLPEYQENIEDVQVPLSKERMVAILVNENGDVMVNKEPMALPMLKDYIADKLRSKISLPKNKKLVISVKTDRKTNYNLYIQVLDQAKGAYSTVWEEYAQATYATSYEDLEPEQLKDVKAQVPFVISLAEPEKIN